MMLTKTSPFALSSLREHALRADHLLEQRRRQFRRRQCGNYPLLTNHFFNLARPIPEPRGPARREATNHIG